MSFPASSHTLSLHPEESASTASRKGFQSCRMLTAFAFLIIIVVLCVGVAFLDRKMVLAISFDTTPTNVLIRSQSSPITTTPTTIPDPFASTIPTTPEPRVSKFYDPPPFRLIQDDVSGKFDNNRWEVTHIVRNDSLRKKLEIVDGLRNQEVAVFITSTGARHGIYLRDRIIPSSRTWMRQLYNIYVILEDTFDLRYMFRHCKRQEAYNTTHTYFICPNEEPIYLLTRKCTSEYYNSDSACCKVDEAINFITHSQHKVYSRLQYFVHADDDTYFRVDQLLRWLAAVKKARVEHLPIVAAHETTFPLFQKNPNGGIYQWKGCQEIKAAGWYQPFVLNKAALEVLKVATKNYGATQICKAYKLSQDSGLGVLFWMYSLYHIYLPLVQHNINHIGIGAFSPKIMIVHAIRHAMHGYPNQPNEDCYGNNTAVWGNLRYDQEIAEGCGKIGQDAPTHDPQSTASMYDAWDHYFLRNKGINATVGVVGVNEFINATIGADGLVTIPTSVPSPVLIELNDPNNTVQWFSGDRDPNWRGIFWSTSNETSARSVSAGVKTEKDSKNNNNNDKSSNNNRSSISDKNSSYNSSSVNSNKSRLRRRRLSSLVSSRDSESDRKRQADHHLTPPTYLDFNESTYRLPPGVYLSTRLCSRLILLTYPIHTLVTHSSTLHLHPPYSFLLTILPTDTVIVIPLLARLTGYEQTQHAKDYDIKKVFTPFLPSHCSPPGTNPSDISHSKNQNSKGTSIDTKGTGKLSQEDSVLSSLLNLFGYKQGA